MREWKHIAMFDRQYPMEKQAEGIAVSEAVAECHCDQCGFLKQCESDPDFKFPVFAWCARRKSQILAGWKEGASNA